MLLSHQKQFLFVHIAKTGGTSVRAALAPYRWGHRYAVPQFICNKMSQLTGHKIASRFPRHARIIAAKEMLPEDYFRGLFKFAIVRNPWDLQVSSFHHIKRERPYLMQDHSDFESFMKWKFDPDRQFQYHIDTSLQLQTDYLVDLRGEVLVDFIGHYETLDEDFSQICRQLGLNNVTLPHKRQATDRTDFRQYYTTELIDLVSTHFREDITRLRYAFE
ncbi:sulfotransferase family 2 domain-containing protein [Alteromonas sp. D210916BOD_24]|uniref:sulfotransferase family 2 domain-containing protein n=1 Tax=Alteromonas sp. D210916BOD_24 TaxID=3157618 RepID=UPI00399C9672